MVQKIKLSYERIKEVYLRKICRLKNTIHDFSFLVYYKSYADI